MTELTEEETEVVVNGIERMRKLIENPEMHYFVEAMNMILGKPPTPHDLWKLLDVDNYDLWRIGQEAHKAMRGGDVGED